MSDPSLRRARLADLAAEVARSLRREAPAGHIVTLKIHFRGFEPHTHQRRLDQPSQDDRTLFGTAWSVYETTRRRANRCS